MRSDTIVGLSTAIGGAIALIRISGDRAFAITEAITPLSRLSNVPSHSLHFTTIQDEGGELIDEVLVSCFHHGKSYTGEESVEISCHGSPYIVETILHLLVQRGARLAEAGEFTQRAFLNGKLDLAQAEAVADIIAAESKAQHTIAIHQLRGHFSERLKQLRLSLLDFAALLELEIDFSEEDVEFARRDQLLQLLKTQGEFISDLIQSFKQGNVIKQGVNIVLTGKPNVGKSTLFNFLLQEEKAIVSPIAGTTRDTIEDVMVIDGIKFRFVDTAGMRETEDEIEKIGVARAKNKLLDAQTIIHIVDATDVSAAVDEPSVTLSQHLIHVLNKIDEAPTTPIPAGYIAISAKNGSGVDALKKKIVAPYLLDTHHQHTIITNARHHACLVEAYNELYIVQMGISERSLTPDMLAWHLRQALSHLGTILGIDYTEDVLTTIFSRFCIGK